MVQQDIRDSPVWSEVQDYFSRSLRPASGEIVRGSEPTASADGSLICFTGQLYDELKGLPRSSVFAVAEGRIEEITAGPRSSRAPRLSPDGGTLAFLSDRVQAGVFQLYLLARNQFSEAQPVPPVEGTVEYTAWSSDGKHILLGVAGLGADVSGGQGSGTTFTPSGDSPAWVPQVDAGISEQAWRSLWLYGMDRGELIRLTPPGVNVWEATWLGSDAVVAITSSRPDESAWYTAALTRIGLNGQVHEICGSDVQFGLPAGSPHGRRLAVVQAICSDRQVVAGDLYIAEDEAGFGHLMKVDTAGIDVTCTQWLDDNRLGFLGLRGLETVAAVYDVSMEKTTDLWSSADSSCGIRYPEGAFLADGRVVVIEDGYRLPQRVRVMGPDSSHIVVPLAGQGSEHVLDIAGTAEPVAWSAPDGTRIEGILCRPGGDGPFPLVVNIHGGPVWAVRNTWALFYPWIPLLVSRDYAVLHPNPRGSSGRGQEFAGQVFGDMGGADTGDFISGVDALVERGIADPRRLAVMGGSYGGYMSAWLVTQDPRFAAAIPISPVTDWYSQHFTSNIPFFDALFLAGDPEAPGDTFHSRSPVMHASKARTPSLIVAGALDRCTPPGQAAEFHRALLEHDVESTLVIYPEEGHGVRAFPALTDLCARMLDFLEVHLSKEQFAEVAVARGPKS